MLKETDIPPQLLPPDLYRRPYFFLLESSLPDPRNRYTIAAWDPAEIYRYHFEEGKEDPFAFLERQLHNSPSPPLSLRGGEGELCSLRGGLPFCGGWIGYLGYELYPLLEKRVPLRSPTLLPAAVFAYYDNFYVYDHWQRKGYWVSRNSTVSPWRDLPPGEVHSEASARSLDSVAKPGLDMASWISPAGRSPTGRLDPGFTPSFSLRSCTRLLVNLQGAGLANFTYEQYLAAIQKIKAYLKEGDVYQVNLSQQFQIPTGHSPYQAYQHLRETSPAPYSAFLNLGESQILSSSPECFLRVNQGKILTRPIKGTRPRGRTPQEDAALKEELMMSPKDRAELLMIVDLERNDLGRVCQPGSVRLAPPLYTVESFPQVHHLVASIEGKLKKGKDVVDLLRATFPGGSITGAPKVRAMEIIHELEPHTREVYTGAIGFIDSRGNAAFNIAIRTMVIKNGEATFWSGGGIVADSDPEKEYEESLIKAEGIVTTLKPESGEEER